MKIEPERLLEGARAVYKDKGDDALPELARDLTGGDWDAAAHLLFRMKKEQMATSPLNVQDGQIRGIIAWLLHANGQDDLAERWGSR